MEPILMMKPVEALTREFKLSPLPDAVPEAFPEVPISHAFEASAGEERRQGFRVGEVGLMIRYEEGSELTDMPPIYRLPNTAEWFCGVANLHGLLVPVLDLARYLGIERDPRTKQMLLVLSHGPDAAGVTIDGLPERLRWTEENRVETATAPPRIEPHVRTACLLGDRLWFDLDSASLLGSVEQALKASL